MQMISRRVIRPLRHLGDLEAGSAAVATGYDPLMADEPALSLAASVTQRMTYGARAGQKVRCMGAGCGSESARPTLTSPAGPVSTGVCCTPTPRSSPIGGTSEKPLPRSTARGAITPTPRQQGVEGDDAAPESPRWSWAQLLKRVFAMEMATCPLCRQRSLQMIAAITQAEVIHKILRHLKRAADSPPMAPARARQETFD